MTVTDSVWCAKPPRQSRPSPRTGSRPWPTNSHAGHHAGAQREGARRALMRLTPRFCSQQHDGRSEHAAEIGGQERQPGEQRDLLQIEMPRTVVR